MTNRKAATLSGTLLARKGAAQPAGSHEPSLQDFVSGDLVSEDSEVSLDSILEPVEVAGIKGAPAEGAALAPELLNIRSVQPGFDGESTALTAGPRPGAHRLWRGDAEVTEISQDQPKPWKRTRWRLAFVIAAILAAILAGLYGRTSSPPATAEDAAEVSPPPAAERSIRQAGVGSARAALPSLAGASPPPPNLEVASLADRKTPKPLAFAALPLAQARGAGDAAPIRAAFGPTAGTVPNGAVAAAPATTLALASTPRDAPLPESQVPAVRPEIAARLPQQKPESPLSALLSDAGNGFFVQLGSLKTAVGAMREWDKLTREFPGVLSGRPLKIERVALADRGAFYRIRTGPFSGISRARAICAEFAARDRGCLVIRR